MWTPFTRRRSYLVLVVITLLTPLFILHPWMFANAQMDQATSFRLSRIETEIRSLHSEIRQLETTLSRVERNADSPISRAVNDGAIAPNPSSLEETVSESLDPLDIEAAQADLMFDQLATLVIETRQDMFVLQDKVSALEQALEAQSAHRSP